MHFNRLLEEDKTSRVESSQVKSTQLGPTKLTQPKPPNAKPNANQTKLILPHKLLDSSHSLISYSWLFRR